MLEAGGEPVPFYEGTVTLKVRVRLEAAEKKVPDALTFEIRYQACNDNACLAPASLPVRVPLGGGR